MELDEDKILLFNCALFNSVPKSWQTITDPTAV